MPKAVYHAYGYVKKAAATVNAEAGQVGEGQGWSYYQSRRGDHRWQTRCRVSTLRLADWLWYPIEHECQ